MWREHPASGPTPPALHRLGPPWLPSLRSERTTARQEMQSLRSRTLIAWRCTARIGFQEPSQSSLSEKENVGTDWQEAVGRRPATRAATPPSRARPQHSASCSRGMPSGPTRRNKGPRPGESAAGSPTPADSTSRRSKRSVRRRAPSGRVAASGPAREPESGPSFGQSGCSASRIGTTIVGRCPAHQAKDPRRPQDAERSGTRRTPSLVEISTVSRCRRSDAGSVISQEGRARTSNMRVAATSAGQGGTAEPEPKQDRPQSIPEQPTGGGKIMLLHARRRHVRGRSIRRPIDDMRVAFSTSDFFRLLEGQR